MIAKTIQIGIESGLHARPAAQFVKTANRFQSAISVTYRDKTVNAKSMIEMMLAAASQGEMIELKAEGPDEAEALTTLEELLTKGMKE
jgi:phosphotransferase system HPr (HPr) family protein